MAETPRDPTVSLAGGTWTTTACPEGAAIALIAFDLDNTLYDEGHYYRAAFRVLAPRLAARAGCDTESVERLLTAVLTTKGRHYNRLFNDVLGELGLPLHPHLDEALKVFATITGPLSPFPGARRLLADLGRRYRLGLITSGRREVQENKLDLLDLARHFEHVVFSSTLAENKPGRMPFQHLLDLTGVVANRAAYVGDNPLADFAGANALGMLTIRVRNREFDALEVAADADGRLRIEGVHELRGLFL